MSAEEKRVERGTAALDLVALELLADVDLAVAVHGVNLEGVLGQVKAK